MRVDGNRKKCGPIEKWTEVIDLRACENMVRDRKG